MFGHDVEKALRYNKSLLCFVDLKRTFYTALKEKIWDILASRSVEQTIKSHKELV